MAFRAALAFRGSVAAADDGAAVGGGAAGQGVVELEVDLVQEVAVGLCLVSSCLGFLISNGYKPEQGSRLSCRDGVEVIFAQIHRCTAGPISTPRGAFRVGAVGVPGIRLARIFASAAGHDPDVPFFRIDRTGRQAEGVIARVILKSAAGGKFLAVNDDAPVRARAGLHREGVLSVQISQPVHHLHELIPASLAGLGRILALRRAYHQRHNVFRGSGTVIQAPFVDAGGRGTNNLVECTLLIGVQLCGNISIRRF